MAETQAGYVVPGIKLDSIVADEATITGMVKAFAQAQIEARDSHSNVVAATEALIRSWSSDTARRSSFRPLSSGWPASGRSSRAWTCST
ncbi:hypothetical protein [Micromonospora sp. NPDC023814]|uniref:hypothetical protein n=1 Tax=Micromonospora sp. NPDC023814 TaxID=3154596 RepID=UPI0033DB62CD